MSRDLTPIKYENWKLVKFSDVCKIVNGQVDPKVEPYSSMIHIGNANIEKFTGRLLECKSAKEDNQTSGKYLFDERHVLYGKINPQFAKVTFPQFRGVCSADVYPIETNDKLLPLYLKYILLSDNFTKYSISLSGRTGIPKVNREDMYAYKFLLPPLKEQQKIAEILSSVDAAIEKTEQVIAKTEEVKKGLMQQLLTKGIGHTEYKDSELGYIPSLWNLSKLSDISHKINDGAHHTPTYTESGVNFLRVTDIKGDTIDWGNTKFISKDEHEVLIKRCNPELGDILLSKNGTIGQVKLIDFDKEFSIFVSLCLIKPNHDLIYNKFLAYYLQTDIVMKQFLKRSKSGTVTNLHLEEIRQVTVPIPPYEEQLEIAQKIDFIHCLLNKEMKRYEKLAQIKRGLMQQLLTGQVRVKID